MGHYEVAFTSADVKRALEDIVLSSNQDQVKYVHHELTGGFVVFRDRSQAFLNEYFNSVGSWGKVPNQEQLAYVKDVANTFREVDDHLRMVLGIAKNIPKSQEKDYASLTDSIRELSEKFPLAKKVEKPETLDPKRLKFLREIDAHIATTFYTYNRIFNPERHKDRFNLKKDLRVYHLFRKHKDTSDSLSIGLPTVAQVETTVDYFTYVVLPLIRNVQEHAYDPINDIQNRLNDPTFVREVSISSDFPDTAQGVITVTVEDNGFGVRADLYERLFERGVSRKADAVQEHGIGLWGVKQFIEKSGGTIRCESTLGEGTKFIFTVPYHSIFSDIYKQALSED